MERLTQDQVKSKKDMNRMKGKVDQIFKTIIAIAREEELQQVVVVRNVVHVFPSASQPALINLLYGVPHRFYHQPVLPRPLNQWSAFIPQPKPRNQAHNQNQAQARPRVT